METNVTLTVSLTLDLEQLRKVLDVLKGTTVADVSTESAPGKGEEEDEGPGRIPDVLDVADQIGGTGTPETIRALNQAETDQRAIEKEKHKHRGDRQ